MIKLAIVGYEFMPFSFGRDIVTFFPNWLARKSLKDRVKLCYNGIAEELKGRNISVSVQEMLQTDPNALGYLNYRQHIVGDPFDEDFINEVKKQNPELPILLSTGKDGESGDDIAKRMGIHFIDVPFAINDYVAKLEQIV